MRYKLRPATPRPLSAVIAGAASDARWLGVVGDRVDSTRRHERQHADAVVRGRRGSPR